MATPTYDLLDSTTLGSSVSSVTFSSISQDYRDLIVVVTPKATGSADARLRINSDTGSNYYRVTFWGNGSSLSSSDYTESSGLQIGQVTYPDSNEDTVWIFQFLDYTATDKHKHYLTRLNKASSGVEMMAGRWASTSAITTLYFFLNSGSYAAGSTFYIYGIAS